MYLQIGSISIPEDSIQAIFDLDNASISKVTRDFIKKNKDKIIEICSKMPRSMILTVDKIYISDLSAAILSERIGNENGSIRYKI